MSNVNVNVNIQSTETAVVRIVNYIPSPIGSGKLTALVLLDLSAKFNAIDHAVLILCLQNRIVIAGISLSRIRTCLIERSRFFPRA